jgi:hypothetical protein
MPRHALCVLSLLAQYEPELQPILEVQRFPRPNLCGLLLLILIPLALLLHHNMAQILHLHSHTVLFLSDILRGQRQYQLLLLII